MGKAARKSRQTADFFDLRAPTVTSSTGKQRRQMTFLIAGHSWTADDRIVASFGDGNAAPWPKVPRRLYNS
jgi:hypothetical protein